MEELIAEPEEIPVAVEGKKKKKKKAKLVEEEEVIEGKY